MDNWNKDWVCVYLFVLFVGKVWKKEVDVWFCFFKVFWLSSDILFGCYIVEKEVV